MVSKTAMKQDKFNLLSKDILNQGATYFSLIILDDNKNMLYYKSTNDKWHEKYVINEYYKHCHLVNRTNELIKSVNGSFTLPWDFVNYDNEISKEIDALRNEHKISHGVSFCNKNFHLNEKDVTFLITLAGRNCDINFAENAIAHKKEIMSSIINSQVLQKALTIKD